MLHALAWLWGQIQANVLATPFCTLVAALGAVLFRRPIARWWHKHFGVRQDLADIRAVASAAHRIAADLHERLTGEPHPDAPPRSD